MRDLEQAEIDCIAGGDLRSWEYRGEPIEHIRKDAFRVYSAELIFENMSSGIIYGTTGGVSGQAGGAILGASYGAAKSLINVPYFQFRKIPVITIYEMPSPP